MTIGLLTLDLRLPDVLHLKAKRSVLAPLLEGLRREWNVAVAETEHRDAWQRATVAVVTVNTDSASAHRTLTAVTGRVERTAGVQLLDYTVEML